MLNSIKQKKFFKIFLLSIFLLFLLSTSVFAVNVVKITSYVNDYVGVLNSETTEYINRTNNSLSTQTGAQIIVVVVKNLDGSSVEDYATKLFRETGIGDKTKNNGVLMLLSIEDRAFRIATGPGVEGCLPDGKVGRIEDEYIIPYFMQNQWNEGIRNGYSAILDVVAKEYNVEVGAENPMQGEYLAINLSGIGGLIIAVIISFTFGMFLGKIAEKFPKLSNGIITLISLALSIPFAIVSTNICKDMYLGMYPSMELENMMKAGLIWIIHFGSLLFGGSVTSKKIRYGSGGGRGGRLS